MVVRPNPQPFSPNATNGHEATDVPRSAHWCWMAQSKHDSILLSGTAAPGFVHEAPPEHRITLTRRARGRSAARGGVSQRPAGPRERMSRSRDKSADQPEPIGSGCRYAFGIRLRACVAHVLQLDVRGQAAPHVARILEMSPWLARALAPSKTTRRWRISRQHAIATHPK